MNKKITSLTLLLYLSHAIYAMEEVQQELISPAVLRSYQQEHGQAIRNSGSTVNDSIRHASPELSAETKAKAMQRHNEIVLEEDTAPIVRRRDAKSEAVVEGDTELHLAVRRGDDTGMINLLRNGAAVDAINAHGDTPLHLAARSGYTGALLRLFDYKANVNVRNNDGLTPLYYSVENNDIVDVASLIGNGADFNVTDVGGNTLLHLAAKNGEPYSVRCFLERWKIDPNSVNKDGQTPLQFALESKSEFSRSIQTLLIENGARIDTVPITDVSMLHQAIRNRDFYLIEAVIDKTPNINAQDSEGNTPLHLAVHGYNSAITDLLNHGANPNIQNNAGDTPLHLAFRLPVTTIKLLKKHGARIDIRNKDGKTAYDAVIELCTSKNDGRIEPGLLEELQLPSSSLLDRIRVVISGDPKQPSGPAMSITASKYGKDRMLCIFEGHNNIRAALEYTGERHQLRDSVAEEGSTSSDTQESSSTPAVTPSFESKEQTTVTNTTSQQQPSDSNLGTDGEQDGSTPAVTPSSENTAQATVTGTTFQQQPSDTAPDLMVTTRKNFRKIADKVIAGKDLVIDGARYASSFFNSLFTRVPRGGSTHFQ